MLFSIKVVSCMCEISFGIVVFGISSRAEAQTFSDRDRLHLNIIFVHKSIPVTPDKSDSKTLIS